MQKQQTIQLEDGRYIVLPPYSEGQAGYGDLTPPDIRDTYSSQRYPILTKLVDADRVFYMAQASSVGITTTDLGVKNGYRQHVRYGAVVDAVVAGAKTIIITVNASDGIAGDGDIAVNELAGGLLVVFNHDNDAFTCRIKGNTATDGGGDITLTLQDEIPVALASGNVDHAECMASWLLGCETNSDDQEPMVGVAHAKVTANYWFWLQTWGPCWLAPQAEVGAAAHVHAVVVRHDGSLDTHAYGDAYNTLAQHVGFTLNHAIGGGQAAPFIMLQICP